MRVSRGSENWMVGIPISEGLIMNDELTPEWEVPTEQERKPVDEAGLYQRYWEAKDRERRREERDNYAGLSIYERARIRGPYDR
jgi:hypothetical protein